MRLICGCVCVCVPVCSVDWRGTNSTWYVIIHEYNSPSFRAKKIRKLLIERRPLHNVLQLNKLFTVKICRYSRSPLWTMASRHRSCERTLCRKDTTTNRSRANRIDEFEESQKRSLSSLPFSSLQSCFVYFCFHIRQISNKYFDINSHRNIHRSASIVWRRWW